MSWVRLDDGFHDHRKTLAVSLEAVGLYALGLTWASRQETNGTLPKRIARHLARVGDAANICEQADELVAAGLWHDDGEQYVIHDFLDYNPSAKSRASKKKEARERMRVFRKRSKGVRANNSVACAHVPRGRDGTGTGSESSSSSDARARSFESFWALYPKKVGKGAARRAWTKLKPSDELVERIAVAVASQRTSAQWTKDDGRFIPNPATWLNEARWDDELAPANTRRLESGRTQGNLAVGEAWLQRGATA